jgi:hypothetical protein
MASRCEEETVANWSTPRDQLLDRGDCLRRQREKFAHLRMRLGVTVDETNAAQ